MNESVRRARLAVLLVLALGACGAPQQAGQPAASPSADIGEAASETPSPPPPLASKDDPEVSPAPEPIRVGSPEDAIRAYYAAVDAGAFARAYRLWARDGQASGQTYARFRQGFAATSRTEVAISGPVESEGAAGSLYATVPVEVTAVLKDGTRQHFIGHYVLRRVNGVPGASEEQLTWHIESASLRPA